MTMNVLLRGTVGSTAYGLAGSDSDVDKLGIFAYDTQEVLSLTPPKDSVVQSEPDVTMHEAKKALKLIMSCNPTATEILWLPEHLYDVKTSSGEDLTSIRGQLLSAKLVRNAYMGYATQQFKRLLQRNDGTFSSDTAKRTAKHARHLKRLVFQGFNLYTSGNLLIELENPQEYHDFGEMVAGNPQTVIPFMSNAEKSFDKAKTVLPSQPDKALAEAWLQEVRKAFYT